MTDDLVTRAKGRLAFLVDRGEIKTPELIVEFIARIEQDAATIARLERKAKTFGDCWKIADEGRIAAEAKLAQAVEVVADRLHGGCDCPACKPLLDFLAACGHTEETALRGIGVDDKKNV